MHLMGGEYWFFVCVCDRSRFLDSGLLPGDLNLSYLDLGSLYWGPDSYLGLENDPALISWDWVRDRERDTLNLFLASDSVPMYKAPMSFFSTSV